MKLYVEKKDYDWMDSYEIVDANGTVKFSIESILMAQVGHEHIVRDDRGWEVGRIKERISTMKPVYEISQGGRVIGRAKTDRSFFKKEFMYLIVFQNWKFEGDAMQGSYHADLDGKRIVTYDSETKDGSEFYAIEIAEELPPDIELKAIMLTCGVHLMRTSNTPF